MSERSVMSRLAELVPDRALVGLIGRTHRRFEPELAVLDAFLPATRRVALDVGAWYGPWTLPLARRFDRVIALEPNPAVAGRLRSSLPANVELRSCAASAQAGRGLLHAPTGVGAEGVGSLRPLTVPHRAYDVEVTTIDAIAPGHVDLLKIDVEGHELEALQGARGVLERDQPVLVLELEQRHAPVEGIIAFLDELGYQPHVVIGGRVVALDDPTILSRQPIPRGYISEVLRPQPGRISNVIFRT